MRSRNGFTTPIFAIVFIASSWILTTDVRAADDSDDLQERKEQLALAPHTIMIQTSLESAMDQVKGLRSQLKLSEKTKDIGPIADHYKVHEKQFREDLKSASQHQKMLTDSLKSYPDIARENEYKSFTLAFNDLGSFAKEWASKAKSASYWKNAEQVKTDLDGLEKRLADAMGKNRVFASDELDFSFVG